ncbi:hypothetical protein UB31_15150 [Bradyrhizobium sp. LTSP849]|uniref:hypothetical protein n=1 Tax=Bradyrhizobium sp. LTSP849 TaxID=1615890 RepID=UPI0005D2C693|nr:hypothetical protein [Bradyrhizobium sp. LTSP849]KJC50003.1 hypothetical protein UB31_15150 [Bradyrhizobium sp. LTSP849]
MSLVSYLADITERRVQDGAHIIFDDYNHVAKYDHKLSPQGQELVELAEEWGTTRQKLIEMRQWIKRITKACEERLALEKVVLCTLNEARDQVLRKQYMTKGEASKIAPMCGGEILDLEAAYNGLMVRGRYLLVSESAVIEGLKKYAPDDLLNGLIKERTSA